MPVYKVIIPQLAVMGNVITGQDTAESKRGCDELYLVVGKTPKSTTETAVTNAPSGRKRSIDDGAGDDKSSLDRFKLVMFDTAAHKVRRKVSTLRGARQSVCSILIDGEEHVVVASKRRILVYSMKTRQGPKITNSTGAITCVAASQTTGVIVTGHEKGEICVWHDVPQWVKAAAALGDNMENLPAPVFTTLHWHAHAVQAVGLSFDGQYIYSGGEEAVLVVWQVSTNIKAFVPRLGGAITHIGTSKGSAMLASTTLDNCIHVIDTARLREEWSLRGLFVTAAARGGAGQQWGADSSLGALHSVERFLQSDASFRCAIKIEPTTGLVMCNGYPGELQALELGHRRLRYSHEIAQFTRVSRTEAKTRIYVPSITHFEYAARAGSAYLASVDTRRGEDKERSISLKFWTHDLSRNAYKLSAQVEHPHGHARVNAVCLHASQQGGAVCITGGSDGSVKLWRALPAASPAPDDLAKDAISWMCAFSFKHKDSPVLACALSRDGSALAISQENVISVWDPTAVSLRATLLAPCSDAITYIAFVEPRAAAEMGGGVGQAYLVAGSRGALYVFDLLTLQLSWCANGDFHSFAVATSEQEALPFRTGNPIAYAYIAASVQGVAQPGPSSAKADAAVTPVKGRKQKAPSGGAAVTDDEEEEDGIAQAAPQNHICFFAMNSPVPVATEKLVSSAINLCFTSRVRCGGSEEKPVFSSGLLCITEGSELLVVAPSGASVSEAMTGDILAANMKAPLPGLNAALTPGSSAPSPAVVRVQTNESLASLFSERSESLPAVSVLSNSFLGRLLREHAVPAFGKTPGASAAGLDDGASAPESFVLPGMESVPSALDDADAGGDDSESRVFFKRGRPRSMSFEARGGPVASAATTQAQDTAFLRDRVGLLGKSLLGVFTADTPAPAKEASGASQAASKPLAKHRPAKSIGKQKAEVEAMDAVSEGSEEEQESDEEEENEDEEMKAHPAKKAAPAARSKAEVPSKPPARERRSSSITSTVSDTAPTARASRSRSELSDASEASAHVPAAPAVAQRPRADSAMSEASQDSTASSLRRSARGVRG